MGNLRWFGRNKKEIEAGSNSACDVRGCFGTTKIFNQNPDCESCRHILDCETIQNDAEMRKLLFNSPYPPIFVRGY